MGAEVRSLRCSYHLLIVVAPSRDRKDVGAIVGSTAVAPYAVEFRAKGEGGVQASKTPSPIQLPSPRNGRCWPSHWRARKEYAARLSLLVRMSPASTRLTLLGLATQDATE